MNSSDTMWLVKELDIDSEYIVAVCYSQEVANNLAKHLESEEDNKVDEYKYSYYVTEVRVHNPEENV